MVKSQKVETQTSTNLWMDQQQAVCPRAQTQESANTKICYNKDKPWKHAEQEKQVTKDHILYDPIYMKCPELANP